MNVNPDTKKKALRMITYGMYIVTASDGAQIAAGAINWLSQASFQPPLIMVGIKVESNLHRLVKATGALAINICAEDQKDLAASFFAPSKIEGNTINGYMFEKGETGAPLLLDTPAFVEARVVGAVEKGDHSVFVVEVINAGVRRDAKPLDMWTTGWYYGG
jgi:flavin reductase (DIM6/NTAB) family NADH-FMN oxidoreductase RutF